MRLEPTQAARRTFRLFTRAELLAHGLTKAAIEHRVRRGRLHWVHRGVYSLDPPPLRPGAREVAVLLACGPGAVLSHRAAAVRWELLPERDGPIDVSLPTHRRGPSGVRLHRADAPAVLRDGIPITPVARTLADLAATAPRELERVLNEARVSKLVTDVSLHEQLQPPRRGTRALRAALTTGPTLHRSEPERRLQLLVARARLPRPETNVRVAGYEVDLLFRAARLVVEVDGYAYHSTPRAFERDRRKDADLQAAGLRVLRLTARQIALEPETTVALLARAPTR